MSLGIGSKVTIKPQEDFFKAVELADVRPLPGSEFEDANLKKIYFRTRKS